MKALRSPSWVSRLLQIASRLWRPHLRAVSCVSRKSGAAVEFPSGVLSGAARAHITLQVRWPFWWWPRRRRLIAKIVPAFPRDEVAQAGQDREALELVLKQSGRGTTDLVRIGLPKTLLRKPGPLTIALFRAARPSPIGKISLSVLDSAAARNLLVESLRLEDFRLWIRNGAECYPGEVVPVTATHVVPEFSVRACPLSAFLPPLEETVTINLRSGEHVLTVHQQPIQVGLFPVRHRVAELPIRDNPILSVPGPFYIEAEIAGRLVARVRLRVLAELELLRRVQVASIRINVEGRDGRTVVGQNTLRWEEHRAFCPELQVITEVPAPNTLVKCLVRTLQGTTVLKREEFMLPLNRSVQKVRLERVQLGVQGLQARPQPARLLISVCIQGEVKASAPVLVLPPERISNFEGQLRFDAHELPFEESEYEQIVQRLGLTEDLSTRRGFRPWLRRLLYGWGSGETRPLAEEAEDACPGFPEIPQAR